MTLPFPEAAVSLHTADLGMTGSGKSSTGKLIIEDRVASGYRVCILDPLKSDHWGLTVSADGKRPGLPFTILGGPHAHLPIEAAHGAAVGKLVAKGTIPLSIVDMARFPPGGMAKFFVGFAEELKQSLEGVLYLVLEEAHLFAPKERSGMGEENAALHYSKMLATGGRSMGVRLIVMTQRVQSLHNAVLSSCPTLIAHRLQFPADQKPVIDWLKANAPKDRQAGIIESLSTLNVGEAWVCSPGIGLIERMQMPPITTFDNSATPQAGEKRIQPKALASADLEPIRAALVAALPKPAPPKGKAAKGEPVLASVDWSADARAEAEKRGRLLGYAEGYRAGWNAYHADLRLFHGNQRLDVVPLPPAPMQAAEVLTPQAMSKAPNGASAPQEAAKKPQKRGENASNLHPAAAKMLRVIDTNPPVKRSWHQVATLAGLKARGGHYNAGRKSLVESGLIEEAQGLVWLSGKPSPQATSNLSAAGLINLWAGALRGAAPRILRALFIAQKPVARSELASALEMQPRGGHWNDAWKQLRDNGLVVVEGDVARLAETM